LFFNDFLKEKSWHAGCNNLINAGQQQTPSTRYPQRGRSFRMNRQRAAQLHLSPLHVQQGLFAVLALLITLFAGQQFLLWEQSQQPEAPSVSFEHPTQTHFSAAGSGLADNAPMRMMDVDQAQPADEMPRQERWVF
jgi:hypothetical protein